jgi:pyruvate/2-oxoglutarate dehydrogenase complex dihydrolipoamide acyltransferase (E2) component
MKVKLRLARSGMNMEEGVICKWHRQPGESFKAGEILYEVETEKAIEEVEATADGMLLEINVPAGGEAKVGEQICVVDIKV